MSNESPRRILVCATRHGTAWKAVMPDPWFGEGFRDVEYRRADLVDAEITTLRNAAVTQAEEIERLQTLAEELLETAEDWYCYVPEYFQAKHNCHDRLMDYKRRLAGGRSDD